jgi:hypothetical protein
MAMPRNGTPYGVGDTSDRLVRIGGPFGDWQAGQA